MRNFKNREIKKFSALQERMRGGEIFLNTFKKDKKTVDKTLKKHYTV